MARKEAPNEEPGKARVWAEMSITVNLGDYESVKVSLGESRECDDTEADRKRTRKSLQDDIEAAVVRKAGKVKKVWHNRE